MGRPLRIEYAGGCYHVINRGNYRRSLFEDKGAAEAFVRTLGEAATKYHWRIHAYVVMRNHFHLALELTEPNLSEGMKWLQGTWIRRYNGLRKLIGRPFQDRYKALVVEPGATLAKVCHYIHLNPVRAGAVRIGELVRYPWSSLIKFADKQRPIWLESALVLREPAALPDTKLGWRKYVSYLEFLATDNEAKRELIHKKLSSGWCVGGILFKKDMQRQARERGADLERFAGMEPEQVREERALIWEERLQRLACLAKINLTSLPAAKSHPSKALLAAAMKGSSSVSNAWLAQRLAMGQPASASQFARRWMLSAAGKNQVEKLLSRVKT